MKYDQCPPPFSSPPPPKGHLAPKSLFLSFHFFLRFPSPPPKKISILYLIIDFLPLRCWWPHGSQSSTGISWKCRKNVVLIFRRFSPKKILGTTFGDIFMTRENCFLMWVHFSIPVFHYLFFLVCFLFSRPISGIFSYGSPLGRLKKKLFVGPPFSGPYFLGGWWWFDCSTTQPPTEVQSEYVHIAHTFLHVWRPFVCWVGAY